MIPICGILPAALWIIGVLSPLASLNRSSRCGELERSLSIRFWLMTVELDLSIDWFSVVVIQLAEIFYGLLKKVRYKKRMVKNEWGVSHYSLLQMRFKGDYGQYC